MLGRGFAMYARDPRLLLLGTIPALIALLIVMVGVGTLVYFIDDCSALVTWFADDWSAAVRTTVRIVAGIAIMVVALLLVVVSFTALTLIIGDPFYEVISARVEDRIGGGPTEPDVSWLVTLRRNLVDSLRLLVLSLSVGIPLFIAGFLPVVGQTVVPVLDAVFGGWLLAVELTGVPFNRRGMRLAARRRLLRANRALALGFGIPVFLIILLVPFAAIVVIPAAVAGGTLLTRRVLGLPAT
jgi:CysZ protein